MADERLPWFPCYPSKLLGALAGMKAPEAYVYVLILLRIYENNGPCRDSLDAIATRARLNRRIVSDALDRLFKAGRLIRNIDGIHNPVAETVLADANAFRAERKRAGEKGASRRWGKDKENQRTTDGTANAHPIANDGHLHLHLQEQKKDKEEKRGRERAGARLPDDWKPTLDDLAFAKTVLAADQVLKTVEKFCDYWHAAAGRNAVKRDWSATWRNWCRSEVERNGGGNGTYRNGGASGNREGGHRTFASYALAEARKASEKNR